MTAEKADIWQTVTYPLLFPIPVEGGPSITELVFDEPNGEKLEAIEAATEGEGRKLAQTLAMLSILSGQPIAIIRKLNQRDIKGASEAIVPLLEALSDE
jgi:hypothetical protein